MIAALRPLIIASTFIKPSPFLSLPPSLLYLTECRGSPTHPHCKLYKSMLFNVTNTYWIQCSRSCRFFFFYFSIFNMLTRISVCGICSGKLIKVTVVLCWAIILKLSTSGLAKAELELLWFQNRLNLEILNAWIWKCVLAHSIPYF